MFRSISSRAGHLKSALSLCSERNNQFFCSPLDVKPLSIRPSHLIAGLAFEFPAPATTPAPVRAPRLASARPSTSTGSAFAFLFSLSSVLLIVSQLFSARFSRVARARAPASTRGHVLHLRRLSAPRDSIPAHRHYRRDAARTRHFHRRADSTLIIIRIPGAHPSCCQTAPEALSTGSPARARFRS